jgi:hypothetical protein
VDRHAPEIEQWLQKWPPTHQEQAKHLASAVHAVDDRIDEAVKWRRLTFTVDENWHHWLCAVAVAKTGASLVFHKGALLNDPSGLLQGDGRYTRQIPHDQAAAHPTEVAALVREALAHQTDMLDE